MTDPAHRTLDVPPAPVRGPRGGSKAGLAVLVAVVVVVAGAIGLAQLDPAPTDPARISFAVRTPAPTAVAGASPDEASREDATPTPDPSAILARTTPRMSRSALAAAVRDGSLDGRLVFVDGAMSATPVRCQSPAQGSGGCVDLEIPGLGLPVWQGESATPWVGAVPQGAWLVTVARTGGLVFLGTLVPTADGSQPITAVPFDRAGTLHEAVGFLVAHPLHTCYRPALAATPCPAPPPFLADDAPLPDGILVSDAGAEVSLAPTTPEVDPSDPVTAGTFLVRLLPGTEGGLQVVARYVPSRAVRVQVP